MNSLLVGDLPGRDTDPSPEAQAQRLETNVKPSINSFMRVLMLGLAMGLAGQGWAQEPETPEQAARKQQAQEQQAAQQQEAQQEDREQQADQQQAAQQQKAQQQKAQQQEAQQQQAAQPREAQQPKAQASKTDTKSKPRIVILATGGTIAGAQTSPQGYGYQSGSFKIEDLINAVPNLEELAQLEGEQVANIGSQDMNDDIWLKLAQRVNQLLASKDVDGIVVTHGTDTMEETAYFLNLVTKSEKPVVLVGSMRPATAVSADGPGNLYNAVAVAASPEARGRGALVVINDEIHAARNVEKMNTTNVETFVSPERGPQGLVNTGKIAWFEPTNKRHTTKSEFSAKREELPRVDIIYAHSNMSPDLVTSAIENGAKGLVIAGVGDGNMTKEVVEELERAVKEDHVLVVRSTRLPEGLVLRNNEIDDDEAGFVASGEFNPAKSRVLAQLALTETTDPQRVQKMFNTY